MGDAYTALLDDWRASGGDLFVAYSSVEEPSMWGSWGANEYQDQPAADAPKWQALQHFVTANACWWDGC